MGKPFLRNIIMNYIYYFRLFKNINLMFIIFKYFSFKNYRFVCTPPFYKLIITPPAITDALLVINSQQINYYLQKCFV